MTKEQIIQILQDVWNRETSVDEAFEIIEENINFTNFPREGYINISIREW